MRIIFSLWQSGLRKAGLSSIEIIRDLLVQYFLSGEG